MVCSNYPNFARREEARVLFELLICKDTPQDRSRHCGSARKAAPCPATDTHSETAAWDHLRD